MSKLTSKQKDEVIEAMTRRLIFAVNNYKYTGGMVRDSETGKHETPIFWFASALEMVGITFDKDDLAALHKPAAAKRKYFADKRKAATSLSKVQEGK